MCVPTCLVGLLLADDAESAECNALQRLGIVPISRMPCNQLSVTRPHCMLTIGESHHVQNLKVAFCLLVI